MRSANFLYFIFVLLTGLALATLFWGLGHANESAKDIAIPTSAILAACAGWIFNNATNTVVKVREASFAYLQESISNLQATNVAARLAGLWNALNIEPNRHNVEELRRLFYACYPEHELFQTLRTLANFYEQMAVAVQRDAVDERMLRVFYASSLRWFFTERLKFFLPLYRNEECDPLHPNGESPAPGTFSETEWLAHRWRFWDEIEAAPSSKRFFSTVTRRWKWLGHWWRDKTVTRTN